MVRVALAYPRPPALVVIEIEHHKVPGAVSDNDAAIRLVDWFNAQIGVAQVKRRLNQVHVRMKP